MDDANTIRLGICDDHPVFVDGLEGLITKHTNYQIKLKEVNGNILLEKLISRPIDILLLDINMPEIDGMELTKTITEKYPDTKIIILSMKDDDEHIVHLMELGASAYLFKEAGIDEIKKAIDSVVQIGHYHTPRVASAMAKGLVSKHKKEPQLNSTIKLTPHEKAIINYLSLGHSSKEIAKKLYISVRTLEGQKKAIMDKANVKNTPSLISFAHKNGILK